MLLSYLAIFIIAPCYCSAFPTSDTLSVALKTGTFRGVSSGSPNNTEKWLGIPFAEPPVGRLRFKAPVPITRVSHKIQDASQFGDACPQVPSATLGAPMSEDCLTLNVWRPAGTDSKARLPVLVWFYGGAYMHGATSDPTFDPTRIINRSVSISKPVIFVHVAYRVNTFGFLASKHVPPKDLNAGLQDQQLALAFLRENVAAFGGDPDKVTIWGQSAGAGSVAAHILFPQKQPLFRAAIMDSNTGPFKTAPPASTYDEPDQPYTNLLKLTGCAEGPASFECLQNVPYDLLQNVTTNLTLERVNRQLWQPAMGPPGSFFFVRPSERIASGEFLHVPMIGGTNLNEGTQFAQAVRNLSTPSALENAAFDNYIRDLLIDPTTVTNDTYDVIHRLYPADDPSLGAPFNTGDSLYDRAEAWYTDNMFLSARRLLFEKAAALQPSYAYFFTEFIPGNDPALGVSHASELALLFGPVPDVVETEFANQMLDFFLNFVNDLEPGATWPRYTPESKLVLQLMRDNITAISDDFHRVKTNFDNSKTVLAQMQK